MFERSVPLYDARLRAYARRFSTAAETEDDIVQSTWAAAWEKRSQWTGRGSFLGWLIRIERTIGSRARHAQRRVVHADDLDAVPAPPPENRRAGKGWRGCHDAIADLVVALPARQRRVVVSRVYLGRNVTEIAQSMGIAPGTVKATFHQAVRRMRPEAKRAHLEEFLDEQV